MYRSVVGRNYHVSRFISIKMTQSLLTVVPKSNVDQPQSTALGIGRDAADVTGTVTYGKFISA